MIYFMVVLEAGLCEAEAYINGIPVVRADRYERYHVRPVNHYLLPGDNTFALAVHLGPSPSRAWMRFPIPIIPLSGALAKASLWQVPEGLHVGDPGSVLVGEAEWYDDGEPVASTLPFVRNFSLPGNFPFPIWMNCEPLQASQIRNVLPELRVLSRSLAAGEAEPFIAMAQPRFDICSAAFGVDSQNDMASFRKQRAQFPEERFLDVDAVAFQPRVIAHGRLVDCLDRTWRSPLRTEPDATGAVKLSYQVRMGKQNGQWRIYL